MEKKQYKLCIEVLNRLNSVGILKNIILIGSWCIMFYKYYFLKSKTYSTLIRTRDIDFLIPIPLKFKKKLDVFKLIKDLGFLETYRGPRGYMQFKHPDLVIEFLVPERGCGSDKPYSVPQLGINAQPLRYLDFLVDNTIMVDFNGLNIRLPHPAAYALHKFIIFKRRLKLDKRDRDIEGALRVFQELINNNEHDAIKRIFNRMHRKWQKAIINNLKLIEELQITDILESSEKKIFSLHAMPYTLHAKR